MSICRELEKEQVVALVEQAIYDWNVRGDKNGLKYIRKLLPGKVERQFSSAVYPFLHSSNPDKLVRHVSDFEFREEAGDGMVCDLRRHLQAVRANLSRNGAKVEDMPLAIAFCIFIDAVGLGGTATQNAPAGDSSSEKKSVDESKKRTSKKRVKRLKKRKSNSVWTVSGGSTGLQQTHPKFRY